MGGEREKKSVQVVFGCKKSCMYNAAVPSTPGILPCPEYARLCHLGPFVRVCACVGCTVGPVLLIVCGVVVFVMRPAPVGVKGIHF